MQYFANLGPSVYNRGQRVSEMSPFFHSQTRSNDLSMGPFRL